MTPARPGSTDVQAGSAASSPGAAAVPEQAVGAPWAGRRILVLVQQPGIEGPLPKHTPLLIQGLRDAGVVVETAGWGRRREGERWVTKVTGRFADLVHVLARLRRTRFDALVVKSSHDSRALLRDLPLAVLARRLVPCIAVQFHGGWSNRLGERGHQLFQAASGWLQRWTDGFLLLSSEECADWQRFRPQGCYRRADNPFVARHPVPSRPTVRQGLPVALLVGRLIPEKGVLDLVEAVVLLAHRCPVQARIAGAGPLRETMLQRARDLGVADRVTLLGYLGGDALAAAYLDADVFVLPTYWGEGFATVVTEAMSVGLPVITTRMRGMADHLVEGRHALFVPARDPAALAEAMATLLGDPALRERMSLANREKVADFSPREVAYRYAGALAEIAGWTQRLP